MITRKQIVNRLHPAIQAGIPVTNYGMAISYMHGAYERSISSLSSPSLRGAERRSNLPAQAIRHSKQPLQNDKFINT